MKNDSPLMGFWEKLRMKLDRVSSTQGSTSKYESQVDTSMSDSTTISSVNSTTSTLVTVNVYDMLWINDYVSSLGIGVYHTGVVVHETEYSYGGHPLTNSGVFAMLPKDTSYLGENYSHKLTLSMGYTDFTAADIALLLDSMTADYRGDQYHLLHKNCNHFSDAFVQILCGRSLPKWINRLATIGSKLPFIERTLPVEWLTPYQQIINHMNKQEESNNDLQCTKQSISSFTAPEATLHHSFRRWNGIERLQNCVHRLHNGSINRRERNNRKLLLNDVEYDAFSLFNMPIGEQSQSDHNCYSCLTQSETLNEANSEIYPTKIHSNTSTTSNKGRLYGVGHFKGNINSNCSVDQQLQSINSNKSNTRYDPCRNFKHHEYSGSSYPPPPPYHSPVDTIAPYGVSLPSTPLHYHSKCFHKSTKVARRSHSIAFDTVVKLEDNFHENVYQ
ncbi:Desumoylating isopeptidase 2 isoform 1 [Schistosoma japonicum]|uniref:Desumoylating isopeptidase 2 isoform 1 n=2 Tax=Schistosoma japonicum TaxID=6182 RepID=A0A4Z2DH37_SCHJA|nr:Desumoylating isopeptidase 2 isoform 1 [Schistosoma japonicum]